MKLGVLALVLALGSLGCRSTSSAEPAKSTKPTKPTKPPAAWSYAGETGPAHWGDLSADYSLAKTGKRQSPIDIRTAQASPAKLPPLQLAYEKATLEILNNGHTVEDEYHGGGVLTLDGHQYKLAQFHFHSPSEHTVNGSHAPMEMHLVHKDADGDLAVIGVLIQEGAAHPELAKLSEHLPAAPGRAEEVPGVTVDPTLLLPASLASFRYSGSLTTPPCSEDVSWFVLRQPIQASAAQLAAFRAVISGNNRPTQPLNGRVVAVSE